jgi:Family of unknown function (DUF5312)
LTAEPWSTIVEEENPMAKTPVRPDSSGPSGKPQSDAPVSFLNRILSLLGIEPDPDRERKILLRELKASLRRSKGRFFIPTGDLVDVGLAKAFYEMYAVVGPTRTLLANASASNALKMIFIEQFLGPAQLALQDQFKEESIRELSKTMAHDVLALQVKDAFTAFSAVLELETQKKIDARYNLFLVFMDFVEFNFYFMLKKFDSMLPESDFTYLPRWEAINGEYVLDDLKDFLTVSGSLTSEGDWESLFDILKSYKGIDVVSRANWKKMMSTLGGIRRSGIVLQLVQYLSKDPSYLPKVFVPNEHVVEPYLTSLRQVIESTLNKISQERKLDKVNSLVLQVFGTTGISRTKNYTEKANLAFQKKRMGGFSYVESMNYLKAFLLDYYKRDIRELVNLLLVKGQWVSNALVAPMSESFHQLMEVSDRLTVFDEALADDADRGSKLKVLLSRVDKDLNAQSAIKQQLKDINSGARALIIEAAGHFIVIGKHLKMAMDDYVKPKHELVLNWKMLETSTDKVLKEWMTATYKQLYAFVQLMQFFVKEQSPQA